MEISRYYRNNGAEVSVCAFLNSDPNNEDSDGDGIPDGEDTAPFTKGYAGGIVGNLSLVSYFNSISDGSGHSFFVYHSYIDDNLNVSGLRGGRKVSKNHDGSVSWKEVNEPDYYIQRDHYITFGAMTDSTSGALINSVFDNISSLFDNRQTQGGVYYNEESNTLLYSDNTQNDIYHSNCCIDHELTSDQLNQLLECLSDHNYYNLLYHNCSSVVSIAWNTLFNDDISPRTTIVLPSPLAPFGLIVLSWDSPECLKNNLSHKPHREFYFNHLINCFWSEIRNE